MSVYMNQQPKTVTKEGIGNAWASVAATADIQYQLVGFSGGGSLMASSVDAIVGGTTILRLYTTSGNPVSEIYMYDGPVTGTNQSLAIRTQNVGSNATGCTANLLYRIVL